MNAFRIPVLTSSDTWIHGGPQQNRSALTRSVPAGLGARGCDSIPRELLDAAAIDGASSLRTLRSVVLPLSRPILGVVSIFAVVAVWKDFLWPMLTLPDPGKQTVNVGIYSLAASVSENWLLAALAIASLPTLIIFLIFQRNIMSGLTAGSLKG